MGGLCQVPKITYTISYAFNIALLIVIIVITTTERLFECICLLSKMLQSLGLFILLEGFTNFSVDLYYNPLLLVMILNNFSCQLAICTVLKYVEVLWLWCMLDSAQPLFIYITIYGNEVKI